MLQKFPIDGFKLVQNNCNLVEILQKNYNEYSDEGFFLEVDVQYLEKFYNLHNDFSFLPERMKIEKAEKLAGNLHNKMEYVKHIKNLKQAINHGFTKKTAQSHYIQSKNLVKIIR